MARKDKNNSVEKIRHLRQRAQQAEAERDKLNLEVKRKNQIIRELEIKVDSLTKKVQHWERNGVVSEVFQKEFDELIKKFAAAEIEISRLQEACRVKDDEISTYRRTIAEQKGRVLKGDDYSKFALAIRNLITNVEADLSSLRSWQFRRPAEWHPPLPLPSPSPSPRVLCDRPPPPTR